MPITDEHLALLKKQGDLVAKLKGVLATQQRTLASLGTTTDDYEAIDPASYDGCDSDNEGEMDRLLADAARSEGRKEREDPTVDAAEKKLRGPDLEEDGAERGFAATKPWLGAMKQPTGWDWDKSRAAETAPPISLELEHAHGYRGRGCRDNVAVATADGGGSLIIYPVAGLGVVLDPNTNTQKFFTGHDDDVLSLSYCPAKRLVATGQQGKRASVCVWNVDAPAAGPIAEFRDHKRAVVAVAISPDGSRVASVGLDDEHSVIVHDIATKAVVAQAKGDTNRILGVHWNHTAGADQNKEFVTVGVKHTYFWTMSGGELTKKKALLGRIGSYQTFTDAAFTPDYTLIACESGEVYSYDGNKLKSKVDAHNGAVFAVATDIATGVIVTGGRDGFINVWDHKTMKNVLTVNLNTVDPCSGLNSVKSITFAQHAQKLIVGTITSSIFEVTLESGAVRALAQGHFGDLTRSDSYGEVWGLSAHPTNPNIVATCAEDGTVRTWDLKAHKLEMRVSTPKHKGTSCCYSPNGKWLAVGFDNGRFALLNASDLSEVAKVRRHKKAVQVVRFSPDSSMLCVGSADCSARLFTVSAEGDLTHVAQLSGASSRILHIDFSADSKFVMLCSQAYELLFYTSEGQLEDAAEKTKDLEWASFSSILGWNVQGIWPKEADGSDINMVNKSRNSKYLAVAGDDGLVKVFNYPCVGSGLDARGSLRRRPESVFGVGHSEHVTNVEFSANDDRIVSTGGADLAILQWKVVAKA